MNPTTATSTTTTTTTYTDLNGKENLKKKKQFFYNINQYLSDILLLRAYRVDGTRRVLTRKTPACFLLNFKYFFFFFTVLAHRVTGPATEEFAGRAPATPAGRPDLGAAAEEATAAAAGESTFTDVTPIRSINRRRRYAL